MYYLLGAVILVIVGGLVLRHLATRKLTLPQLVQKVHRLHAYYQRIHPGEPEFKIKLAVVTACLTSVDWETRRQMAHSSESLEQMAQLIFRYQDSANFRSGPTGFGSGGAGSGGAGSGGAGSGGSAASGAPPPSMPPGSDRP
jgi:uncharacterized membrane protein YgcG